LCLGWGLCFVVGLVGVVLVVVFMCGWGVLGWGGGGIVGGLLGCWGGGGVLWVGVWLGVGDGGGWVGDGGGVGGVLVCGCLVWVGVVCGVWG